MSLGEVYYITLALRQGVPVLTGDPEFVRIEEIIPIMWLEKEEGA